MGWRQEASSKPAPQVAALLLESLPLPTHLSQVAFPFPTLHSINKEKKHLRLSISKKLTKITLFLRFQEPTIKKYPSKKEKMIN